METKTAPVYSESCFQCAVQNKDNFYASKKLHLVIGSLGLVVEKSPPQAAFDPTCMRTCKGKLVYFEYGNPAYSTLDNFMNPVGGIDGHCWLEDDSGNVYDMLKVTVQANAELTRVPLAYRKLWKSKMVIEMSKTDAFEKLGLKYYAVTDMKLHQQLATAFEQFNKRWIKGESHKTLTMNSLV